MILQKLSAHNFRNIDDQTLCFDSGTNVIYGENASGKTNALEAVYLFASGKSFRSARDKDLVKRGAGEAGLYLDYLSTGTGIDRSLSIKINLGDSFRSASKTYYYSSVPVERVSDFLGNFRAVLFTPDSMQLIKSSPDERRHFLDLALCQMKPKYIYCLNSYYKILSQKNSFLKEAKIKNNCDRDYLDILNRTLAREASVITRQRYLFCERLKSFLPDIYSFLSSDREKISIEYKGATARDFDNSGYTEKRYYEIYCDSMESEIKLGASLSGPQRDDFVVTLGEGGEDVFYSAKSFGSQGQQRSCVLALKLAEGEIMKEVSGEYPVFLLDDLFSELDIRRRAGLLRALEDKQVIITSCDENILKGDGINFINARGGVYTRKQ